MGEMGKICDKAVQLHLLWYVVGNLCFFTPFVPLLLPPSVCSYQFRNCSIMLNFYHDTILSSQQHHSVFLVVFVLYQNSLLS